MSAINKIRYILNQMKTSADEINGAKWFVYPDMIWCGIKYGASPSNYKNFNFLGANARQRETYLTHRDNEKLMRTLNDPAQIFKLEDKLIFAQTLGESQYGRRFISSNNLSIEEFRDFALNKKIICKPRGGGQGRGIEVFSINEQNLNELHIYICNSLQNYILEEWLNQSIEISRLYPDAINPIRIQTLLDGDKVVINDATLTISNGTEIANASAVKAIFALVDVKTGKVVTDGCDYNGSHYRTHPITHEKIKGFIIPEWNSVLDLVTKTAKHFKSIRYIGWDVAITNNGPVIIEGNNDAGYTAYQLYMLTRKHEGIRGKYQKYL